MAQTKNLWVNLSPNAGGTQEVGTDAEVNNGTEIIDLSDPNLNVTRQLKDAKLIYSLAYQAEDIDRDGFNDIVTFDVVISAYTNSTYTYVSELRQSSVTTLGSPAIPQALNNFWGVSGGANDTVHSDIDEGETIQVEVENFNVSLSDNYNVYFKGFTSCLVDETNGGHTHRFIEGLGQGLSSYSFNANQGLNIENKTQLIVTGAGSIATPNTKELGLSRIGLQIQIINDDNPCLLYTSPSPRDA